MDKKIVKILQNLKWNALSCNLFLSALNKYLHVSRMELKFSFLKATAQNKIRVLSQKCIRIILYLKWRSQNYVKVRNMCEQDDIMVELHIRSQKQWVKHILRREGRSEDPKKNLEENCSKKAHFWSPVMKWVSKTYFGCTQSNIWNNTGLNFTVTNNGLLYVSLINPL